MRVKLIVIAFLFVLVFFSTVSAQVDYADVARTHWAYDAIVRLTDLGILSGIRGTDGRYYYQGTDPLNRYQAAVLIEKLLNYVDETYMGRDPSDLPVSDDALRARLQQLELAMTDRSGNLVQMASVLERVRSVESQIERIAYEGVPNGNFATVDDLDALKRQVVVLVDRISYASRDVDNLSEKFAALDKALGDINQSLSRQINIVGTDVTELHQSVRDIERNLSRVMENYVSKSVLTDYVTRSDLSSTLRLYVGVGDLEDLEKKLSADLARIEDTASDLSTRLANANRTIANIAADVEANKAAVAEVKEIGTELSAMKNDISGLRSQLNDLTRANAASFSALREGMDELSDMTGRNAEKLEELDSLIQLRFDTTFNLASKNEQAIRDVALRVDGLEQEIAATRDALGDYVKADELEETEAFANMAAHIGELNNAVTDKADADDLARVRRTANWGIGIGTTGLLVGIGVIVYLLIDAGIF
jgi:predicted  nucleic acid-binding Zn-ribbon protein